jgi:MFS family permease
MSATTVTLHPQHFALPAEHGLRGLRFGIGKRWVVTAAATLAMMSCSVAYTTVSVFMVPLSADLGWQRAEISGAYTLMTGGAAVGGLLAGKLADRLNTRFIALFGAIVLGLVFAALSMQRSLQGFLGIYLVMGLLGCAALYTPVIATVGLWFERRGLVTGIVTAGGAIGQGLAPLILQPLIGQLSWPGTYMALAIVFFAVVTPIMWLIEKPPAAALDAPTASGAAWPLPARVSIAWLSVAAFLCCCAMATPLVHLVPLMIECGKSPVAAGTLFFTVMVSGAAGRLSFGLLADRTGGLIAYIIASFIQTVTLYGFVALDQMDWLMVAGVIFGFGYAGVMTSFSVAVREAVPAKSAGFSTGIVVFFAWLGMGAGGGLGGYLFDLTGSYAVSFAAAVGAGAGNLLTLSVLLLVLTLKQRRADPLRG